METDVTDIILLDNNENNNDENVVTFDDLRVVERDGLKYHYVIKTNSPVCGAKRKSNGLPCTRKPSVGRNRCYLHGGKSPRGLAHPNYKHGNRSRDIIARKLGERYQDAIEDDRLLELRQDIAIIEYRLADLIENMDSSESGSAWRAVRKTYNKMRKAVQSNDQQGFSEALNELGPLINRGVGEHARWAEITNAINSRKNLVESERKRLIEMKQMMTAEQAMSMLTFIISVIRKHVKDQETLASISAEISAYIGNR